MPLTDLRIRQAKPASKAYKLFDGGGLYLLVTAAGSKLWRYKYRIHDKENVYSIGAYPAISLLDARREHVAARDRVNAGEHPVQLRRRRKNAAKQAAENTFEAIGEEWFAAATKAEQWSTYHTAQVRRGLDQDLFPRIGQRPIAEITVPEMLDVLRTVEARGAPSVAINLRQWASAIFLLAARTSRCTADPAGLLKGVILRPPIQHATALGREGAGVLLRRIQTYGGNLVTRCALELMAYTFVRTIEMRRAEWSEFDLVGDLWMIPAPKMKMRRIHVVPITPQVRRVLDALRPLTGAGQYLFPNSRRSGEVMSATTINRALEHMGYASGTVTGHDFRATASTILYEKQYREELVEMQLAHAEKNKTKGAYNHAQYLEERRAMMRWFADELDASAAEQAALALARRSVDV